MDIHTVCMGHVCVAHVLYVHVDTPNIIALINRVVSQVVYFLGRLMTVFLLPI